MVISRSIDGGGGRYTPAPNMPSKQPVRRAAAPAGTPSKLPRQPSPAPAGTPSKMPQSPRPASTGTAPRTVGGSPQINYQSSPQPVSYSGGGGLAPLSMALSEPVPQEPAIPTDADFLSGDSIYQAALASYKQQFDDLMAQLANQKTQYGVDFDNSVNRLGYIAPLAGETEGTWATGNEQTAAGRAYQSLIQDFAARGLLSSGDFVNSEQNLYTDLGRQHTDMVNAKNRFEEDINAKETAGKTSKTTGETQAKAEALARKAAQYGSVS